MGSIDFKEIIPFEFWALSSAMCLMLILLAMFLYIYYRTRLRAVVGDSGSEAEIAAKVETLKIDEKAIRDWIASQKEELQRLEAERNEQEVIRGELQRIEQECFAKEEVNRSLRDEVGALENQKFQLSTAITKLESDNEQLTQKIESLESNKEKLDSYVKRATVEATEKKKELEEIKAKITEKSNELSSISGRLNELKTEAEALQYRKDSLQKSIDSIKEKEQEIEVANKRLVELKQDLEDTRHEVAIQQNIEDETARKVQSANKLLDELIREKSTKEAKISELDEILSRRKDEFSNIDKQVNTVQEDLHEKKSELARVSDELSKQLDLETESKSIVEKLKAEETKLNSTIKTLEVLAKKYNKNLGIEDTDTKNGVKYRDLWIPVTFAKLSPSKDTPSEQSLLQDTAKYIKGQGLHFPERVLHAFHTALKVNEISPLVVLAGISGTGKSELPRRYAEGMGMHSVILAVQPRWDSPQDLFGFYNYLEERYKATELARAMVQFEQFNREKWPLPEGWDHDRSDRMLLVLLDEMNLARVEYYFSEFLSRLETRRGINLDVDTERAKAEIALDMGSLEEDEDHIKLFPGQNVLFSGTMNEDETTQALSDKVLDRSCVLRFGRPKRIESRGKIQPVEPTKNGLTHDQWKTFLSEDLHSGEKEKVTDWINRLNDAMEQLNRPFGHRVAQAIQSYIANYPSWVGDRVELAMADQIEQRIMPKLRGVETSEADQPLSSIQQVISECKDSLLLSTFKQGADSQQGIFIWRGLDRSEDSQGWN